MTKKIKDDDIVDKIVNVGLENVLNSDNIDDFNPTLALIIILAKEFELFEKKDIIPKRYTKAYALLSNTNQVQKDMINELIAKQNDNKGQIKGMYFDLIKETLRALKSNINTEKTGIFEKLRNRL